MQEVTNKTVKKTLSFDEKGETFSIEMSISNASPDCFDSIEPLLDTLYERTKKCFDLHLK